LEANIARTVVDDSADVELLERLAGARAAIEREVGQRIVGQSAVVEKLLVTLLAGGHSLLVGVPGLAKTTLIATLAETLRLDFHRIQFTPDLMPSDITGTDVLREDPISKQRDYEFIKGPIFANMILGDEINRTPPKTQAAMLEAMQERMISAGSHNYELPKPFFVLATQNPLEQEGTYPLPEAQLDRFLLYIKVGYPTGAEEWDIARRVTGGTMGRIEPVLDAEKLIEAQNLVTRMPVCDQVVGYAHALVRATRPNTPEAPEFVNKWVNWGAGPRGVLALVSCAKSRALLHGRYHATIEDVQAVIAPALRHRLAPNYAGLASGINSEKIIEMLLDEVSAEKSYEKPGEVAA